MESNRQNVLHYKEINNAPFAMTVQLAPEILELLEAPHADLSMSLIFLGGNGQEIGNNHTLYVNGFQHEVRYNAQDPNVGDIFRLHATNNELSLEGCVYGQGKVASGNSNQKKRMRASTEKAAEASREIRSADFEGNGNKGGIVQNHLKKDHVNTTFIETKIPLRSLVIHELALTAQSLPDLIKSCVKRLEGAGDQVNEVNKKIFDSKVTNICKAVARPSVSEPVVYTLLNCVYNEINAVSFLHFNVDERGKVKSLVEKFNIDQENFKKQKQRQLEASEKLAKSKKAEAEKNSSKKRKSEENIDTTLNKKVKPIVSSPALIKSDHLITEEIRKYLKQLQTNKPKENHPPIKSDVEYERFSSYFKERYKIYDVINKALSANRDEFKVLSDKYKSSSIDISDKQKIYARIMHLNTIRIKEVEEMEEHFESLHKPSVPNFSSGPTAKRPGWSFDALKDAPLGRSHRAKIGKVKLAKAIDETKRILEIPEEYRVGIVPASDTGAYEMAMWTMLGPREVDVLHWESFGKGWFSDATKELNLKVKEHSAPYGEIPDLSKVDTSNKDVLFTWNGTTSGACLPNGDWIDANRKGLTFCDATSAVFAMRMPWEKLDITTYSWQKVLGGEGAHGMLILSPRAVERLESYKPSWPLPKIFRLTEKGKLIEGIFKGDTINTPSMLCVEDYLDALKWADSQGGLKGLVSRANSNLEVFEQFVNDNDWIDFLTQDKSIRSNTSVCFKVNLSTDKLKKMISLLDSEGVAHDIASYRDAPDGLRIWGGATVEKSDIIKLTKWLSWAYESCK